MTKLELENIISQKNNLHNLPNVTLTNFMDSLSNEFEMTKNNLLNLSHHLDNVENLYNLILEEYKKRTNE